MDNCSEKNQKELFDSIGDAYLSHYNDKYSVLYRQNFFYTPLVQNIDLKGRLVLDGMCGSGQMSEFLQKDGCILHALDLSERQIKLYNNRFPNVKTYIKSIVKTDFPDHFFDIVVIFGGLHHVHPYVKDAVAEVFRILKPGGYFLWGEPHEESIVNSARKIWYRKDDLFMDNESAITYCRLKKDFSNQFDEINIRFFGNIAYYLVYNSMIFRIPLSVKKIIAPFFLFLESIFFPFHTRFLSSYIVVQWKKKK